MLPRVLWWKTSGLVGRVPSPSVARLGGEVWTAREERQKNTYKADLQINGAPSRAAQQVLKECTATGAGEDQLLCGSGVGPALLASGLSLSSLAGALGSGAWAASED